MTLLSSLSKKNISLAFFVFIVAIIISIVSVYFIEYIQWLFAALIFIALVLFAFRFPFYSFLLFIITLPFEAAFVIEADFTIRISYILLIITILGLFFSGRKLHFKSNLNIPIFIFLAVSTLSLLMTVFSSPPLVELGKEAGYRGTQLRSIIQLLFLFFFVSAYFLTLHFCSDKKRLKKVLKAYIGIALVVSIYGVYQFFAVKFGLPFVDITSAISTGGHSYGVSYYTDPSLFRAHATFQEPLNFGHYLLSVIPFLLTMYIFKNKSKTTQKVFLNVKWFPILIFIMLFALFLTKSRGAWIGFLASMFFLLIMIKTKYKLKLVAIFFLIALIIGLFFFFYSPGVYQTISEEFTHRFSAGPRLTYYSFIFDLWKEYPILGVGIGNYGWYGASYFSSSALVSAHGVFQNTLVETGILGFLSLIFLVSVYYRIIMRTLGKVKDSFWYPYCLGFLASFIAMTVQYFTFGDHFNLYFWVFLGMSMAAIKIIKKKKILAK
ncbi:O-antigen ligase family protein [Candidatus Parcubacteria bacterium]|nr:O-antigen ligase family protein [Candidatus Parcubacteria bacterium]